MTEIGKYKETEMVSSGCQELRKEEIRKQGWTKMVEFLSEVIKIFWNKRIVTIAQSWDYAKNQ